MENITELRRLGLFDARVPRYTSYPPATAFGATVNAGQQAAWLGDLDPGVPVSVYLHIPFCERLCWFCACRTQGTSTMRPVAAYLDSLRAELAMLRDILPDGVQMRQLHWGGGTPTILTPEMITTLATDITNVIPAAPDFDFSVEIDPTLVDQAKITALAKAGMTRASIGIQDFAPDVQNAIGRQQSYETTAACIDTLRDAKIRSLNADLVYGLPHQTLSTLRDTLDSVLALDPDRIALFGYAHVPTFSARQKMIPVDALPDELARYDLAQLSADVFRNAGYTPIGIDHFAKPTDSLAHAKKHGHLHRNFQGYTDDTCPTLIGIGASAISRLPQGYVQNAPATAAYRERIGHGQLAGCRGYALSTDDALRADAIGMLMCSFRIDLPALAARHKNAAALAKTHQAVCAEFAGYVARDDRFIRILPNGRPLTRLIANRYDAFRDVAAQYSQAS
ncbi:oxygen-independent coproporphyrinogen III oxidase [Yoonia sp. 2307UL14-13]|uniref:oxygen-independent coproporphyrinogen III oxidase n=1 Tax=Yoonia sp. 2307UL14-13 TaxID=3126506 RepID=UPI0030A78814